MTTTEVAEYMGVCTLTVYRWIKSGQLPAKRGQPNSSIAWNIAREDLEEFLFEHEKVD